MLPQALACPTVKKGDPDPDQEPDPAAAQPSTPLGQHGSYRLRIRAGLELPSHVRTAAFAGNDRSGCRGGGTRHLPQPQLSLRPAGSPRPALPAARSPALSSRDRPAGAQRARRSRERRARGSGVAEPSGAAPCRVASGRGRGAAAGCRAPPAAARARTAAGRAKSRRRPMWVSAGRGRTRRRGCPSREGEGAESGLARGGRR